MSAASGGRPSQSGQPATFSARPAKADANWLSPDVERGYNRPSAGRGDKTGAAIRPRVLTFKERDHDGMD